MNSRQKFLSVMNFEENASIPKTEFAYWAGTIRNWFSQGLPKIQDISDEISESESIRASKPLMQKFDAEVDKNVMPFFKMDSFLEKFPIDYSPMLKKSIIRDESDYTIFIDKYGLTNKILKQKSSIPMAIDYPIKNKKDFRNYVSQYDRDFSKRLPEDFDKLANELKNRDFPIRLGGNPFGFSFLARHLMGEVTYMLSMYDDPSLIKEFNDYFLDFTMNYWSIILEKVEVDCIFILEDIAYRSGSFISKEMFNEFMRPYYLKLIDFIKQYRINNIFVDCDGLIDELIPLFMEAGVTGLFPFEAVNDISAVREKYPRLKMMGGFNKKVLFKDSDREKIDAEIEKVSSVMKKGGYIPHVDHAVSEDVTWDNFKYYRERLNSLIDKNQQ
jgi:uroporphyrinogen-III decarboxylase